MNRNNNISLSRIDWNKPERTERRENRKVVASIFSLQNKHRIRIELGLD